MFKDIKKKAEEKATEVKEATSNMGNTVLDKAKAAKDSAADLATGAVKTADKNQKIIKTKSKN